MTDPTQQELMDFVDGTLPPSRHREVSTMASNSRHLQLEISILRAVRKTIRHGDIHSPSKSFTPSVMRTILPPVRESLWLRLIKNSSNMFAMIMVLSIIVFAVSMNPEGGNSSSRFISSGIESFTSYQTAASDYVSQWTKTATLPVQTMAKTTAAKILVIGMAAFFLFFVMDELFGKKFSHSRFK